MTLVTTRDTPKYTFKTRPLIGFFGGRIILGVGVYLNQHGIRLLLNSNKQKPFWYTTRAASIGPGQTRHSAHDLWAGLGVEGTGTDTGIRGLEYRYRQSPSTGSISVSGLNPST